jgi:hypothetical protein
MVLPLITDSAMPIEIDYQQRIAAYDRRQLLNLWAQIQLGETPDWAPGKAFEYLVMRAFELEGAAVTHPSECLTDLSKTP